MQNDPACRLARLSRVFSRFSEVFEGCVLAACRSCARNRRLLVEVAAASPDDRAQRSSQNLKAWIGLLTKSVAGAVTFADESELTNGRTLSLCPCFSCGA